MESKEGTRQTSAAEVKPDPVPALTVSGRPVPRPAGMEQTQKLLLIVVAGILLLVTFGLGWLLIQNSSADNQQAKKPTTTTPATTVTPDKITPLACATGTTTYKNQDAGFGFCYPAVWGAISVATAKLASADTGSRWKVNFASKPAVHVTFASQDWTTKAALTSDATGSKGCTDLGSGKDYPNFTTIWDLAKAAGKTTLATRGIATDGNSYLLEESADNGYAFTGICLVGTRFLNGHTYGSATATYYQAFSTAVKDADAHVAAPEKLIPAAERTAFSAFVRTIALQ